MSRLALPSEQECQPRAYHRPGMAARPGTRTARRRRATNVSRCRAAAMPRARRPLAAEADSTNTHVLLADCWRFGVVPARAATEEALSDGASETKEATDSSSDDDSTPRQRTPRASKPSDVAAQLEEAGLKLGDVRTNAFEDFDAVDEGPRPAGKPKTYEAQEWRVDEDGTAYRRGAVKYPNGDLYDGEWVNGKRHGNGQFLYKSGDKYIGEFRVRAAPHAAAARRRARADAPTTLARSTARRAGREVRRLRRAGVRGLPREQRADGGPPLPGHVQGRPAPRRGALHRGQRRHLRG